MCWLFDDARTAVVTAESRIRNELEARLTDKERGRSRHRRVTNGPPQASECHESHERPGYGQDVPPTALSHGTVSRLRDMLRDRQGSVPGLRQPDVGVSGSGSLPGAGEDTSET